MHYPVDLINEVLAHVESWHLPPEQFTEAVCNQLRLEAGLDLDIENSDIALELHTALNF